MATFVGVDVGGTFTDLVMLHDGVLTVLKVPSTPADQAEGVLHGIRALAVPGEYALLHGSTVATNALLERKGARTALVTTRGCRDVLEIGRQARASLYALRPGRPDPLIPRDLRFEADERLDYRGKTLVALAPAEVERVAGEVAASGAESVAVCLLFSFLRPEHEAMLGEALRARGLPVSLSHEILPEYREYERTATTAINAAVSPVMRRYLDSLQERLRETRCRSLRVMQSNGGMISASEAGAQAVRTVLSGPAAGVVGASRLARLAGFERAIAFDMGGTSTDVSLCAGEPQSTGEGSVADIPVRVPILDIHTVGAGGGSIARIDAGGALRVGPESAGADPGPVCYGRGERLTVTDANLLLGRLYPPVFAFGSITLDEGRARAAFEALAAGARASKAAPAAGAGADPLALARGIVDVANAKMARAVRRISVERGHDPRGFCLVAFGGGGPLHACDIAENLGMPAVLIPRYPGATSALGLLLSDVLRDYSRTVMLRTADTDPSGLDAAFSALEERARADLDAEGVAPRQMELVRLADMRYAGQSFELPVPAPALDAARLDRDFHALHAERFGYSRPDAPTEVVNLRVKAVGHTAPLHLKQQPTGAADAAPAIRDRRTLALDAPVEVPVYDRDILSPGMAFDGPALVVQPDSTFLLRPDWRARVDEWGNLVASI